MNITVSFCKQAKSPFFQVVFNEKLFCRLQWPNCSVLLQTVTSAPIFCFQLPLKWPYNSVQRPLMRVIMHCFTVMRLVILYPTFHGSEKKWGKLCRRIRRWSCQLLNAMNQEYINALLGMELGTTSPRTARLMFTVSLHLYLLSLCGQGEEM